MKLPIIKNVIQEGRAGKLQTGTTLTRLFQLPVIFGLLWLMFTRKLAKITGTLKKYEYEMYDEQRLNNPG